MEPIHFQPMDYRAHVQKKTLEALKSIDFSNPQWSDPFTKWGDQTTQDVIWYLKELVDKKEYIDEIFEIAKLYAEMPVPEAEGEKLNKEISLGEEVRNIYTIKGTLCWLLASLGSTFKTEHYPDIISILEKLAFDPVYYVRIQATVPLSFFARNIRARNHPNGDPFNFADDDRKRVSDLSFAMLREHRDMPRVLEGVVNVFDALRLIKISEAQEVINSLFYNSNQTIQPQYITHQAVPLIIFYAEYRSEFGDGFKSEWFQNFAIELLKKSEEEAPYLRSTFIWHCWREMQTDFKNYQKLTKYIPFFLHRDTFETQALGQYEFLVKEVIKHLPEDGLSLFKDQLSFVQKWGHKYNIRDYSPWLLDTREIVETIASKTPNSYLDILTQITDIVSMNVYVGDLAGIFKAYNLIPSPDQRGMLKPKVNELLEVVRKYSWAGNLPEEV